MTTATKRKTATAELRELEQERDELHSKAREARAERDAYALETETLRGDLSLRRHTHGHEFEGAEQRVRPGTEASKLSQKIRERREQPNPHEAEYVKARDAFHAADERVTAFKAERFGDRLAELDPILDEADSKLQAVFAQLAEACALYASARQQVLSLILDTNPRGGQNLVEDPRVNEWAKLAADVGEIVRPHARD